MSCWYCHYGWPKAVADIYDRGVAVAGWDGMHYGPAHIVWEDENFGRESVQWCLDHFDEYQREESTAEEQEAVRRSLVEMLALSDDERDPGRSYFDAAGDAVELADYPPPVGMELVRR